jgi:putative transposase
MNDKPSRRSTRLQGADYAAAGAYFVTICTHQKACLFGSVKMVSVVLNAYGDIADECWQAIPLHFPHVELDSYIVMPNHIHGILVVEAEGAALGVIVQSFKAAVSRRLRQEALHLEGSIWQRNYYEHIIRNDDDFSRIKGYILENPQRWLSL